MSLYNNLAKGIPSGHLRCEACGTTIRPNKQNFADYLADGWPKCCDLTMRLITTPPQLNKGEPKPPERKV